MHLFNFLSNHDDDPLDKYFTPQPGALLTGQAFSLTKENVTPDTAYQISAYFACIRCISEDVGKLPLPTYRRKSDDIRERIDSAVSRLLTDQPNPDQTSMTFRETVQGYACSWGNGYAEIARNQMGQPAGLYVIHPERVQPMRENGVLFYRVHNDQGGYYDYLQSDILHIRGLGSAELGYSPAQIGAESMGVGIAQQNFSSTFFGNGTHMSGVLMSKDILSQQATDNLRTQFSQRYSGAKRAHKPLVLQEGMEWKPISMPMTDAQFLESRKFTIEEIARWFRMPPHKIQHLANATFSNIEHQSIDYVTDTLQPWLTRWEQEVSKKLYPNQPKIYARHQVQALLRGDQASRASYYMSMFNLGALNSNEIRALEDRNPRPGGDEYMTPMNMNSNQGNADVADMDTEPEPEPTKPGKKASASLAPIIKAAAIRLAGAELRGAKITDPDKQSGWLTSHQAAVRNALDPICAVTGHDLDAISTAHFNQLCKHWVDGNKVDWASASSDLLLSLFGESDG